MRSLDSYMTEYAQSHQNPRNIFLHTLCVPAIFWSTLGFAQTFVVSIEYNLSVAHVAAVLVLIFYATFKKPVLWSMMVTVFAFCFLSFHFVPYLRWISLIVFAIAWVGQFYGHAIEGKKPSFFKDLLFLLIGPVWVIHKLAPTLTR